MTDALSPVRRGDKVRVSRAEKSGAPAPGPFAGRFAAPPARIELIERTELLSQLEAWPLRRLSLVVGPAGYGKTTLLAQAWRAIGAGEALKPWLTLESADRGPGRLREDLSAALSAAGIAAPNWSGTPDEDGARLADHLAAQGRPVWLALDNYHAAQSLELDAFISALLAHGEPGVHVAIAARTRPQIRAAAFAARGELIDIGAGALGFSRVETSALLGERVDSQAVQALHDKAEGWPLALALAARRLEEKRSAAMPGVLQGGPGEIRDYIAEEVFDPLPDALRAFLVETATLENIDAASADRARARADSAALIGDLERCGALVFPAHDGSCLRVHGLLREFLRAQFARLGPDARGAIDERVLGHLASSGDLEAAIAHARRMDGALPPLALLECAPLSSFWRVDRLVNLGRDLIDLDDRAFAGAPRALALRALGKRGAEEARADAKAVASGLSAMAAKAPAVQAREIEQASAVWKALCAIEFETDTDGAWLQTASAQTSLKDNAAGRGLWSHIGAVSALRAGHSRQACLFAQALGDQAPELAPGEAYFAYVQLGFLRLQDSAPRAALAALDAAARLHADETGFGAMRDAWAVSCALLAYERGEAWADAALPAPETGSLLLGLSPELAVEAASLSVRAAEREQGYDVARGVLERARACAEAHGWRAALHDLAGESLSLALRAGTRKNLTQALQEAKALLAQGHGAQASPRIALALAGAELQEGAARAARARLAPLLSSGLLTSRWMIAALLVDARAANALQASHDANANLAKVLNLSRDGALCATFFEYGAELFSLLVAMGARLAAGDPESSKLMALVDLIIARPRFTGDAALEAPSAQEAAMFEALRRRGARADAAQDLDISENTLKFYLKRVFAKWGVNDWRIAAKVAERIGAR